MSDPEYEVPNIDFLIELFPSTKKDDKNPNHIIKSWEKKVIELKYLMKIDEKKGVLVFCTYRWPDVLKGVSSGIAHKGWKYYQAIFLNTYHCGHIETDHHVICLMSEEVTNLFCINQVHLPSARDAEGIYL